MSTVDFNDPKAWDPIRKEVMPLLAKAFRIAPFKGSHDNGRLDAFHFEVDAGSGHHIKLGESVTFTLGDFPNYQPQAQRALREHMIELGVPADDIKIYRQGDYLKIELPEDIGKDINKIKAWAQGMLQKAQQAAHAKGKSLASFHEDEFTAAGLEDPSDFAVCLPPKLTHQWLLQTLVEEAREQLQALGIPPELQKQLGDYLTKVEYKEQKYDVNHGLHEEINRLLALRGNEGYEPHRQALYDFARAIDNLASKKITEQTALRKIRED